MPAKRSAKRAGTAARARVPRPLDPWVPDPLQLSLTADDVPLLEHVLSVYPRLRVVAAIGREARRRGVRYPVATLQELQDYLGDDTLAAGWHRVDREAIGRSVPASWFPIEHERELLARVHLALIICEQEATRWVPRAADRQR